MPKQKEVAALVGISQSTYCRHLKGQRVLSAETADRCRAAEAALQRADDLRDELLAKLDCDFLAAAIRSEDELAKPAGGSASNQA